MFFIYVLLGIVIILFLFVFMKTGLVLTSVGEFLVNFGWIFLLLYAVINLIIVVKDKEIKSIISTIEEWLGLFMLNLPIIGFFIFFLGPASIGVEEKGIIEIIAFVFAVIIVLGFHALMYIANVYILEFIMTNLKCKIIFYVLLFFLHLIAEMILSLGRFPECYFK